MNIESTLESLVPLVTVIGGMVAVPLGALTFYLRSLRDNMLETHAAILRRIDAIEATAADLRHTLNEIPRDYTTKDEWLRELLHARRVLEQVTESTIRIQTTLDSLDIVKGKVLRATESR